MVSLLSQNWVNVITQLHETPLRFFEVNEEFFLADSAKFCHAKLCITPKRFDAVNMIFSSREFVFLVVNAVVVVTICHQPTVRLPSSRFARRMSWSTSISVVLIQS